MGIYTPTIIYLTATFSPCIVSQNEQYCQSACDSAPNCKAYIVAAGSCLLTGNINHTQHCGSPVSVPINAEWNILAQTDPCAPTQAHTVRCSHLHSTINDSHGTNLIVNIPNTTETHNNILINRTLPLTTTGHAGNRSVLIVCGAQCNVNMTGTNITVHVTHNTKGSLIGPTRIIVAGHPKTRPISINLIVNCNELVVSNAIGTVAGTCRRLVTQSTKQGINSQHLTTQVTINATALVGSFTPTFESVYFGGKANLGPDPQLIATLTSTATLVIVLSWSTALVLGFDSFL